MQPILEKEILKFFGFKPLARTRRKKASPVPQQIREQARVLVLARLHYFNQFYNFSYKRVFIKNQRTRWGSCSSNGNLNFNYRIVALPPALQDYLVVHELCHLQELNHHKAFWDLVALQIPDYRLLKSLLERHTMAGF